MYSRATAQSDSRTQTMENTLTNGFYSVNDKKKRGEEGKTAGLGRRFCRANGINALAAKYTEIQISSNNSVMARWSCEGSIEMGRRFGRFLRVTSLFWWSYKCADNIPVTPQKKRKYNVFCCWQCLWYLRVTAAMSQKKGPDARSGLNVHACHRTEWHILFQSWMWNHRMWRWWLLPSCDPKPICESCVPVAVSQPAYTHTHTQPEECHPAKPSRTEGRHRLWVKCLCYLKKI